VILKRKKILVMRKDDIVSSAKRCLSLVFGLDVFSLFEAKHLEIGHATSSKRQNTVHQPRIDR
jgi:hypothetical protein